MRGRPLRLGLDRVLQRTKRLGLVVLLEEQQPPRGVDGGVGRGAVCRPVERVGIPRPAERVGRPRGAKHAFDIRAGCAPVQDLGQEARGHLCASKLLVQQAELKRSLTPGVAGGGGFEDGGGFRVLPADHRELTEYGGRGGIAGGPLFRERLGLGRTAARNRASRHRREALHVRRRALPGVCRRKGRPGTHIEKEGGDGAKEPREATRAGHSRPGSASGLVAIIERGSRPLVLDAQLPHGSLRLSTVSTSNAPMRIPSGMAGG